MAKAAENPSTLFRSLRPDDEDLQTNTGAAAREAEQRWPLFKAVAPRKLQPTPLLSEQERSLWSTAQKPSGFERKPALSVPATGNKLAQSLSKMGGRPAPAPLTRSPPSAIEEESFQEPLDAAPLFTREEKPAKKRRLLSSNDVSVEAEQAYQDQQAVRTPQGRKPLFSRGAATAIANREEVHSAEHPGDSLTRLFSRLEGQEEPSAKPVGKKSALFGRSGKR